MKEYIHEYGRLSESEVQAFAEKYMNSERSVYAVHANRFYCGKCLDIDIEQLTELRIFDNDSEIKISRQNIGKEFFWRFIDESEFEKSISDETDEFLKNKENRVFDEEHFLDIDEDKSDGFSYTTTGGGKYTLPIENAVKVKLRNYVDYDENGIAYIYDFRIVGFTERK